MISNVIVTLFEPDPDVWPLGRGQTSRNLPIMPTADPLVGSVSNLVVISAVKDHLFVTILPVG